MWWRLYFCANRLTIRNDWILNAENLYWLALSRAVARSIDCNTLTSAHTSYRMLDVFIYWLLFHCRLFLRYSFAENDLTLQSSNALSHRSLLILTTKLNTTNYSKHDYSNSGSNCITWRLPYTSINVYSPMLLAYYLFALLCNLVWVLDTLTHSHTLSRSQCGVIYKHIYHKLYFVTRVLFEY